MVSDATNTTVLRNVISGGQGTGIENTGAQTSHTQILGNLIGTTADGLHALGNGVGIYDLAGASNTVIGDGSAASRNVVAANQSKGKLRSAQGGIELFDDLGAVIKSNYIGLAADGITPLGNGGGGVFIDSPSNQALNDIVGGTAPGAANLIACNTPAGIVVQGALQCTFSGNSIFGNSASGIQLFNGANHDIAAPALASASSEAGSTTFHGTFAGAANSTYRVEFFASTTNAGQGHWFLGATPVNTDGTGTGTIFVTIPAALSNSRHLITATLTDSVGDTSGFSNPVAATVASGYLAAAFPRGGNLAL